MLFKRGKAISGDITINGSNQFPNPPINTGITMKKIITKAWAVTITLYNWSLNKTHLPGRESSIQINNHLHIRSSKLHTNKMYIPSAQQILTTGLAMTGCMTLKKGDTVSSGKVLDFAVEKCLDSDGNQRCTKPFLVSKSTCYNIEWSTEGTISHTTVEVKDAASGEMVYYRDTNGDWTPEKGELVYLDFKPKVWKTGNDTVEYKVTTCK